MTDYSGRKVVVLGACGFLGRWIARICSISSTTAHTANILDTGECDLVANQAGNANYLPGTANRSVTIQSP